MARTFRNTPILPISQRKPIPPETRHIPRGDFIDTSSSSSDNDGEKNHNTTTTTQENNNDVDDNNDDGDDMIVNKTNKKLRTNNEPQDTKSQKRVSLDKCDNEQIDYLTFDDLVTSRNAGVTDGDTDDCAELHEAKKDDANCKDHQEEEKDDEHYYNPQTYSCPKELDQYLSCMFNFSRHPNSLNLDFEQLLQCDDPTMHARGCDGDDERDLADAIDQYANDLEFIQSVMQGDKIARDEFQYAMQNKKKYYFALPPPPPTRIIPSSPSCMPYLSVSHHGRREYYDIYCPSCQSFDPPEYHKGQKSRQKCHHWGCYCHACNTNYTNVMCWLAHRVRECKIIIEKWHKRGVFD